MGSYDGAVLIGCGGWSLSTMGHFRWQKCFHNGQLMTTGIFFIIDRFWWQKFSYDGQMMTTGISLVPSFAPYLLINLLSSLTVVPVLTMIEGYFWASILVLGANAVSPFLRGIRITTAVQFFILTYRLEEVFTIEWQGENEDFTRFKEVVTSGKCISRTVIYLLNDQ